jgi:hypothetical protein
LAAKKQPKVAMAQGAPSMGDAACLDRILSLWLLLSAQDCILICSLSRRAFGAWAIPILLTRAICGCNGSMQRIAG